MANKRRALFKCDVTGLVGVYVGTKDAESLDPNQNLKQVVYIPLQDLNEGMINRWKGVKQYKKLWEVTDTKYPKSAIIGPKEVHEPNQEVGIFDTQVVAKHDHQGTALHRKHFVDEEMKHRVDRLESELDSVKKDSGLKDVDNLDDETDQDFKRSQRGENDVMDKLEEAFKDGGDDR